MRFNHHPVSCLRSRKTSINVDGFLFTGLALNEAACRRSAVLLFTGVEGSASSGLALDIKLPLVLFTDPREGRSDAGIEETVVSSSGSLSSKRRSAALSACSALARRASSTTGCGAVGGGEPAERLEAVVLGAET